LSGTFSVGGVIILSSEDFLFEIVGETN